MDATTIQGGRGKPGWIYAVSITGDVRHIKVGLTTLHVESYCHDSYGRTMIPMTIIDAFPVADVRLAESLVFHVLAPVRYHHRREVFDLTDSMHLFEMAKEHVRQLDALSGLPVPRERPVNYARWVISKEAAKKGATLMVARRKQREQQALREERERMQREGMDKAEQARLGYRATEASERERQENMRERKAEAVAEDVRRFLEEEMLPATGDVVTVRQLRDLYQTTRSTHMNSDIFRQLVIERTGPAFKLQHYHYVGGKRKKLSSACLGFRI